MYPTLFHFGHWTLPTFGVLAAAGLMAALGLSERTARLVRLPAEALWNAGLFAVVAAFVLSRLLLLMAYWHSFVAFPLLLLAVPSLTAPGLLLTAAATLAWLRRKGIPVLSALDAWAPCGTLLWVFLALGHFAEASDPGLPTGSRLGMRMPGEALALYPVAIFAALVAALLTVLLLWRLGRSVRRGETAGLALSASGLVQFGLSFLRQPGLQGMGGLDALEWVALGMLAAGALLVAFAPPRDDFALAR